MITALELVESKFPNHNGVFVLRNIEELMIKFAKMHAKAALEEAYENVFINDYDEHEQYSPHIDKDSIIKAYPETNIK